MPSDKPEFSVIIPTYGRPAFLSDAVGSVLQQTVQDFEIIIVDDASPEPQRLGLEDPRIRLIRRATNGGPGAARNTGIGVAKGHYITFLDDDDLYVPERLQYAKTGLGRAPIALCWTRYIDGSSAALRARASDRRLEGLVPGALLRTTTPHVGATAVDASIVARFDETFLGAEDVEWWIRMSRHPVTTVPEVGYLVRRHAERRVLHGTAARIAGSRTVLEMHGAFFSAHPAAAAFRWRRIGMMQASLGLRRESLQSYLMSLRLRPSLRTIRQASRLLRRKE